MGPAFAGTTTMEMSPELAFLLTLGLRMAITAAFVVTASVITERSGPVIGALVATLPISAGPSYVFLALDHDAAFIAEGALASLPINAATIFLGLTYVVLAQRHSALVSCAGARGGVDRAGVDRSARCNGRWPAACSSMPSPSPSACRCCGAIRHVKMPLITRRWYDIPLRASLVATLVATVVTLSGWVGPSISGIIALFPVVFTSMMLILHPRIGGPPTAAVIANSAWGLMGLGIAIAVLHVAALQFGSAIGLEPRAGDLRRLESGAVVERAAEAVRCAIPGWCEHQTSAVHCTRRSSGFDASLAPNDGYASAVSPSAHTAPPAPRAATSRRDAAPSPLRSVAPPRSAVRLRRRRARARRTAAGRRPARARSGRGPAPRVWPAPIWRARSPAAGRPASLAT